MKVKQREKCTKRGVRESVEDKEGKEKGDDKRGG